MQMEHGLAGAGAVVDDDAERFAVAVGFRELAGDHHQVAEQCLILGRGVAQARNRLARNHQQMHRRARIDVLDGDAELVLVHERAGDLARDDLLEQGLGHAASFRRRALLIPWRTRPLKTPEVNDAAAPPTATMKPFAVYRRLLRYAAPHWRVLAAGVIA